MVKKINPQISKTKLFRYILMSHFGDKPIVGAEIGVCGGKHANELLISLKNIKKLSNELSKTG